MVVQTRDHRSAAGGQHGLTIAAECRSDFYDDPGADPDVDPRAAVDFTVADQQAGHGAARARAGRTGTSSPSTVTIHVSPDRRTCCVVGRNGGRATCAATSRNATSTTPPHVDATASAATAA